jgi:hypothetical protein
MIFASCRQCGFALDIFQEPSQLIHAPLACPRCGGLDLKLQTADDCATPDVGDCDTQAA